MLGRPGLDSPRCYVHDDAIMPPVDHRLPDGLSWDELTVVLRLAVMTGRAIGVEVAIFNPTLDADGHIGRALVDRLVAGLSP
jgi:arginase